MAKREKTYKIHPMVKIMPRTSGEAYQEIKASVATHGVEIPGVTWTDPQGQCWLIDGRTRDEIVDELHKEGVETAANGRPLVLETYEFEGTEREALGRIKVLNHARRQMTTSQRAASCVKFGAMNFKLLAREEGRRVNEDAVATALEEGATAEQAAKEAGTNRTYLWDCIKLYKEAPDLLDQVLQGEIKIPEAKRALARIKAGKTPFPVPGEEDEGGVVVEANGKPEEPPIIYDGLKNPVDPDLAGIFATRDKFVEVRKVLKTVAADVEALAESAGGHWLLAAKDEVLADIRNLVRQVMDAAPHVPCPYCSGTGRDGENPRSQCKQCKRARFLDKLQWKVVPDDVKALTPVGAGAEE